VEEGVKGEGKKDQSIFPRGGRGLSKKEPKRETRGKKRGKRGRANSKPSGGAFCFSPTKEEREAKGVFHSILLQKKKEIGCYRARAGK